MPCLYAEVADGLGYRVGAGTVNSAISLSVRRRLDEIGSFSFEIPISDTQSVAILQFQRTVTFWVSENGYSRRLVSGAITRIQHTANRTVRYECIDELHELHRISTLLARVYANTTVQFEVNALLALVPGGWTANISSQFASLIRDDRFDGASVFKAIKGLVRNIDAHMRTSMTTGRVLEIGAFGERIPLLITNVDSGRQELLDNREIALITSIALIRESEDIVNSIIPLGAGEGEAALDLRRANATTFYSRRSLNVINKPIYLLEDLTSIGLYGLAQKVVQFQDIAPTSNSVSAATIAANSLLAAAGAYLRKNAFPTYAVRASLSKCPQTIRPGDQVRVTYNGMLESEYGKPDRYLSINQDMFVIGVNETFSASGAPTVSLEMDTIDRPLEDAVDSIINTVEAVQLRGLKPSTSMTAVTFSQKDAVRSETPLNSNYSKRARFTFRANEFFLNLLRVEVQFRTFPLFATAAAGQEDVANEKGFGTFSWEVTVDDKYPYNLSVFINGVDRTAALGGKWATSFPASQVTQTLDISEYIVDGDNWQREHVIEFVCEIPPGAQSINTEFPNRPITTFAATHGMIECNITLLGVLQAILPD
jgi:hypothetical protein